jgi:hypothetical protein
MIKKNKNQGNKRHLSNIDKSKYPNWYIVFSTITLISTIVIAASTLCNYLTTKNMLQQMNKQILQTDSTIKMQKKYYQKTIRPFLHSDSLITILNLQKGDTTVSIHYNVKNTGSQPAIDVSCAMMLLNKKNEEFPFETGGTVKSAIYPNGSIYSYYRKSHVLLREIRKNPYIHILIEYKDSGNIKYIYKSILYINKLNLDRRDIINIWQYLD